MRPIAMLVAAVFFHPVAQSAPATWELAWADEFNAADGTPPDPQRWTMLTGAGGWGNNELESYTNRRENVQQRDGKLVITARAEDFTGADGRQAHYTSARLETKGHFSQQYGRFEARMKLPLGKGLWPAFWMLGTQIDSVGWPRAGEIDVLENIGEPRVTYSTLHGPGYSGAHALSSHRSLPEDLSVDSGFHVYSIDWERDDICFYVDGVLVVERTPKDIPRASDWAYNQPFFLLLNLAVGGDWPGNPDASTRFPQEMLVDYVRVYRRVT